MDLRKTIWIIPKRCGGGFRPKLEMGRTGLDHWDAVWPKANSQNVVCNQGAPGIQGGGGGGFAPALFAHKANNLTPDIYHAGVQHKQTTLV